MPSLPTTLTLGPLEVPVPVVLAPMAGVTNVAFRELCAEQGAGLYVCEMITSRGLVEGDRTSLQMLTFADNETVRSVQLYGIDPIYIGKAVEILCAEHGVGHVDLNFGCPVPKVTRKGGGAALPWKATLLGEILTAAVGAAEPYGVPVTMKTRKGIDDDHLTYLDAGRIAQDAGCAAIGLHGRTAAQHYSGRADWDAIAALKDAVDIPVLGNGDIWEAADAVRMMEETGCDGVIVGRGCLGRPWLFRDLAAAFTGGGSGPRRRKVQPSRCRSCRRSARSHRSCAGTPSCWATTSVRSVAAWSSASTSRGTSRASRPARSCGSVWARSRRTPPSTSCSISSTPLSRTRSTSWARPAAGRARPGRSCSPTAGCAHAS